MRTWTEVCGCDYVRREAARRATSISNPSKHWTAPGDGIDHGMSDTDLIGLTSPPQMPSLGGVEESSPSSSPTSSRPNKSWPSQPTKKRSHEEMNALQSEGSLQIGPNPSTVIQSSTTAPTMPSPQLSSSTVASLQHKPPTSGQTGSESGTPEQQLPNDEPSDDEPDDPNLPVADFSWDDMEQRYHDTIEQLETDERRLFAQFESLCNVSVGGLSVVPTPLTLSSTSRSGRRHCRSTKLNEASNA